MAKGLNRKRKVRGGHRASTKCTITLLYEAIETIEDLESVVIKLEQRRITLKEKLEILKQLDEEILELVEDSKVDNEIEQADTFKKRIHVAIIAANKALETKQSSRILVTTIPGSGETSSELSTVTVISTPPTPNPMTIVAALVTSSSLITTTSTISAPVTESISTPITLTTSISAVTPLMFSPSISTVPILSHSPFIGSFSLPITPTQKMVSSISSFGTPTSSVVGHSRGTRVKLPKLVPKRFNGDLTKWSTFWDLFESSIHHHLSDIDKFNYLCTLLEGTASEAISGLKLTSTNYREAITILQKRFGNKHQIITKHMDLLLNIEPITFQHNLKGLQHLYDTVESQVCSLKALGVSADSYGSMVSSVFINKLPKELRFMMNGLFMQY